MALRVASKTVVNGASFDTSDKNTKQHWLLLTADKFAAFDEYCAERETSIGESLSPNLSPREKGALYDLSGRKINSQSLYSLPTREGQGGPLNSQLKKGIYIKDGKKILF